MFSTASTTPWQSQPADPFAMVATAVITAVVILYSFWFVQKRFRSIVALRAQYVNDYRVTLPSERSMRYPDHRAVFKTGLILFIISTVVVAACGFANLTAAQSYAQQVRANADSLRSWASDTYGLDISLSQAIYLSSDNKRTITVGGEEVGLKPIEGGYELTRKPVKGGQINPDE